jgi:hypothetical protein
VQIYLFREDFCSPTGLVPSLKTEVKTESPFSPHLCAS